MLTRTFSTLSQAADLATCNQNGSDSDTSDRRVWVRHPCDVETSCQPANSTDSPRFPAHINDISRCGIQLIVSHSMTPGDFLCVELPRNGSDHVSTVLACVLRVSARPEGQWCIGCSLASDLDDDDLECFGAKKKKHYPHDQRSWVRFPCCTLATFQPVKIPNSSATTAHVTNISSGGVGLLVKAPVELGTLLSLDLSDPRGHFSLEILACVARLDSRPDDNWVLGCNLIRELTHRELTHLLGDQHA